MSRLSPRHSPTDQGFDEWYGIPNNTDEAVWMTPEQLQRNPVPADARIPEADQPWIMEGSKGSEPSG